jgi:hypothetical protein
VYTLTISISQSEQQATLTQIWSLCHCAVKGSSAKWWCRIGNSKKPAQCPENIKEAHLFSVMVLWMGHFAKLTASWMQIWSSSHRKGIYLELFLWRLVCSDFNQSSGETQIPGPSSCGFQPPCFFLSGWLK